MSAIETFWKWWHYSFILSRMILHLYVNWEKGILNTFTKCESLSIAIDDKMVVILARTTRALSGSLYYNVYQVETTVSFNFEPCYAFDIWVCSMQRDNTFNLNARWLANELLFRRSNCLTVRFVCNYLSPPLFDSCIRSRSLSNWLTSTNEGA